jgi:hypothetical protein
VHIATHVADDVSRDSDCLTVAAGDLGQRWSSSGIQMLRPGTIARRRCARSIAYSPVLDDRAPGGIGGVIGTVNEITEQIVGERRKPLRPTMAAR